MSPTKHTPGPWRFNRLGVVLSPPEETNMEGVSGFALAEVYHGSDTGIQDDPDALANARLIAAAPDLLAALEELCDGMRDEETREQFLYRMQRAARAAIARAKGEKP